MLQSVNKNLLLICSSFPVGKGETFIETEISYLSQAFNEVTIISHDIISKESRPIPNNIKIIRMRYGLNLFEKLFSLSVLLKVDFWRERKVIKNIYHKKFTIGILKTMIISLKNATRLAKQYKYLIVQNDIKLCYSYWSNDSALALALLKADIKNLKAVSRIHGWDVFFEPSAYNYLPYRHLLVNQLDRIYSISQHGLQYCNEKWRVNTKKITISRLGVSNQSSLDILTKEKNNEFLIVSCSNIIKLKRVNLIIRALSLITKVNIKWIHFGDGDLKKAVNAEAKFSLPNNITYEITGRVSNKEVLTYYQNNNPDLFINVSSSEGVPVSIMEVMSFGIPCIATNVGGIPEIVNNKNGFLLTPNPSANEVAEAISTYYHLNTEEKVNKRLAAYNSWENKYNAEKNYKLFIEEIIK